MQKPLYFYLPRFAALCFFLSTIEFLIPKPLPFLRLGLANLPIILALPYFSFLDFLLLLFLKILGQALLTGSLFSYIFLFSLFGTLCSGLSMFVIYNFFSNQISNIGLSLVGAFVSNGIQILLARYFIFGFSAWYIAPIFFFTGLITSLALGIFANKFQAKSQWLRSLSNTHSYGSHQFLSGSFSKKTSQKIDKKILVRLYIGILSILFLSFSSSTIFRFIIVCFALLLNIKDKSKIKWIPILITSISIIIFNLLVPFGKVLWEGFGFSITQGALEEGIKKLLLLEGLLFISRWILHYPITLPGKIGILVSDSLEMFAKLSKGTVSLKSKNIVQAIDRLMFELD